MVIVKLPWRVVIHTGGAKERGESGRERTGLGDRNQDEQRGPSRWEGEETLNKAAHGGRIRIVLQDMAGSVLSDALRWTPKARETGWR